MGQAIGYPGYVLYTVNGERSNRGEVDVALGMVIGLAVGLGRAVTLGLTEAVRDGLGLGSGARGGVEVLVR